VTLGRTLAWTLDRRSRLGVLLLTIVLVPGCAVDQKKEVAKYRRVLDGEHPSPRVTFSPEEPLTLDKAMRLANQDNERLAVAGEDYLQALINKDRAASAFLPTVSLEPSYTVTDRPGGQSGGSGGAVGTIGGFRVGGSTLRRFEAPVVSRINLFNGGGDVARLRRAAAVAEQRRLQLLDQQALTLLDVAQVYFQVLRSERLVQVLESSAGVQNERVRDIEARQNAGLARPLDVAQTRALAADTRVSLTTARSDARNGRTTLAFLIGAPGVEGPLSFDANGDLAATAPLEPIEAFQERALDQREDVRAARAAVAAARQGVRAAFSQYYPSVSLNFNAFLYRENFDDASKWTAILNANLPIFTAGLIHADVREAWSGLRQAALLESLASRQAVQDVRIAYENVAASRARLVDLRTQADAARDALNQAEASYRVGLATNLERLTAQSQLLNAELQLASEQYDQSLLLLDLTRFTGRIGQRGSLTGTSGQNFRSARSTGTVTGGSTSLGVGATPAGGVNGLGATGVR
jgi:outer membrane protein TolC